MNRDKILKLLCIIALYLLFPAFALVVWGELKPQAGEIEQVVWDKILHFMAYFGLAGLLCVALKADRRVLLSTLGLVLLGALLEILQGFTGRDPSFFDELANTLGAICGAGAGWLLLRLLRPKILPGTGRH
jgi:VanZ family protein